MSINGRIETLEKRAAQNPEELADYHHRLTIKAYHHWLVGFFAAFQDGKVKPALNCAHWFISGDFACNLVMLLNRKLGFSLPDYFDTFEECQQTIDWLYRAALDINEVVDNELLRIA